MRVMLVLLAAIAASMPPVDRPGPVMVQPGRRINLVCSGTGTPTIILTAGAGGSVGSWRRVQPALVARHRVCAWDRAGFGLSDPSSHPQTAAETTRDLTRALAAAHVAGRYVLVGHSIGSYETLLFADAHRAQVAGIVLVDPSIPDQFRRFARVAPVAAQEDARGLVEGVAEARACAAGVRAGTVTPERDPTACLHVDPALPPAHAAALAALLRDPARFDTAASYFAALEPSAELVTKPRRSYGALPLIVLTAGAGFAVPAQADATLRAETLREKAEWDAGHDAFARLSSRGINRSVPDAGHMIPRDHPEAVIVATEEVLRQAAAH